MKVCSKCCAEKPKAEFSKDASMKDGFRGICKSCAAARSAAQYAANPGKARARMAEYRASNREAIKAYRSAYYAAHSEKIKANKAAYRLSSPEKLRARDAAYHSANPEKVSARYSAWRRDNPDKRAANDRNRRARTRSAEGKHTAADVSAIFEAQRGLCANCQTKLFKSGKQKYHVDHIMPLALCGSNWPSNLQCLCPTCNLSKGAKHPDEWAKQQGRLL